MVTAAEEKARVRDRDVALAADPKVEAALARRHRARKASHPLVGIMVTLWTLTTAVIL